MFCKIGDLAVIVNGENCGRLIEVRSYSAFGPRWWSVRVLGSPARGECVGFSTFSLEGNIEDRRLRPLRDEPGDDETLRWKTVPNLRIPASRTRRDR
jgi:hypothetical protein